MPEKIEKTGRNCVVCGGEVVLETSSKYFGVGPLPQDGSDKWGRIKEEYYCQECGIMYKKLPPAEEDIVAMGTSDPD